MSATGLKIRVEKIERELDALYSDTSVGWETTLEALEEIEDTCKEKISILRDEHAADLG